LGIRLLQEVPGGFGRRETNRTEPKELTMENGTSNGTNGTHVVSAAAKQRARYANLKARGLCTRCGNNKPFSRGKTVCVACRAVVLAYMAKRAETKASKGGRARAKSLSPEQRTSANARWSRPSFAMPAGLAAALQERIATRVMELGLAALEKDPSLLFGGK
jgi:hypothetical protein